MIEALSNEELIERVKWSQNFMSSCIEELNKRHEVELKDLRKKLSKIGEISNAGSSPSKSSVKEGSINCLNTSTVVSTISESDKTVAYHNDDEDCYSNDSNRSCPSDNYVFTPQPVGNDCDGKNLYIDDIVEILSPSKNGIPFKSKDRAKILNSPGKQICVRSLKDASVTGYRSGKNLRLKRSNSLA